MLQSPSDQLDLFDGILAQGITWQFHGITIEVIDGITRLVDSCPN